MPKIFGVMKKPVSDAEPLVVDQEVFSFVAAGTGVHTTHVATADVDARAAAVVAQGGVIENDTIVDGRRVVSLRRLDDTRIVLWTAAP